jgi:hypothetical protein
MPALVLQYLVPKSAILSPTLLETVYKIVTLAPDRLRQIVIDCRMFHQGKKLKRKKGGQYLKAWMGSDPSKVLPMLVGYLLAFTFPSQSAHWSIGKLLSSTTCRSQFVVFTLDPVQDD